MSDFDSPWNWMMDLPEELSRQFMHDVEEYEKEKQMPFINSFERRGLEKGLEKGREEGLREGLLKGLTLYLQTKFGAPGKRLMARVKRIEDLATLESVYQALLNANSLDEARQELP